MGIAVAVCIALLMGLPVIGAPAHPCLPCHPREVARFSRSPMARSLGTPAAEPAGTFRHRASGSTVRVSWKNRAMYHQVQERGLSAEYPIAYSIGDGKVGRSYLVELGGHFFQSPAAFYSAHSEWNASPGYESDRVLDFTRAITSDCLFCHAGSVKPVGAHTQLTEIACDRCHGPGDNHRLHPAPGTIINPAKLRVRARDSVCEQCHLEGATIVLNPARYWWDFRPGEDLEEIETHYVYRSADPKHPIAAVSQAEQLALSACWRASNGKLWCGTCHDPHGEAVNRKQQMKEICNSCHSSLQLTSTHKPDQEDCVACHMPSRKAVDVSHAAVTDHRIARRPASPVQAEASGSLVAWHEPNPAIAQRNLGLALFNVARRNHSLPEFQQAFGLLSKLPDNQKDAAVFAAEGYMLLGSGHAQAAVQCFRHSARNDPEKPEYWLDVGVAADNAGNASASAEALRRCIEADPYDYRPYKALSNLYKRMNQPERSQSVVSEFLQLVPQSIVMRLPQ